MSLLENAEQVTVAERHLDGLQRTVRLIPFLLLLVFLAHSLWFFGERAYVEPAWKQWGDVFSDSNVLVAGQHFVDRGFIALKGLATDVPNLGKGPYTGWPPLSDLVNGFLRTLGVDTVFGFRCFTLVTYVLFAVYLYGFLGLMFRSRWAAAAATVLLCMTPYIYLFSDSLHEHMYIEFFRAALLYHFVKYLRSGKGMHLGFGMAFAFLDAYTSWEHVFFMLALFTLYPLLFRAEVHPRVTWWKIGLFGAAVGTALCLFFIQVAWALGGVLEAFVSFKERVAVRTLDVVTGEYFKGYGSNSFLKDVTPGSYLRVNLNRIADTFLILSPLLVTGLIMLSSLALFLKKQFRPSLLFLLFLVISILWLVIFIQHTVIHPFTIRHLGPWVGLLFAFSFAHILHAIKTLSAGWLTIRESLVHVAVAVALAAVLWEPVQHIVKQYIGYYRTYTHDMAFRLEAKRISELGLENVTQRLDSVSVSGAGVGVPLSVFDGNYLTARSSNPAPFWGPMTANTGTAAITVTLANTSSIQEINLYALPGKSAGSCVPTNVDLQVYDANSDLWLSVPYLLTKKPVRCKTVAPGVNRLSYDIGSFTTRHVRVVFVDGNETDTSTGIYELELWGRIDMNVLNENLVSNGDFEKVKGNLPEEWEYFSYNPAKNHARVTKDCPSPGRHCFKISNTGLNDSRLRRIVKLAPGAVYELTGRIKTEGVSSEYTSGAFLNIEGDVTRQWQDEPYIREARDWVTYRVEISTPETFKPDTHVILQCRLGNYGDGAMGTAWFDDIELKRIR